MTKNMEKFLEAVSADKDLAARLVNATTEDIRALARELGFSLAEEDLEQSSAELSDDELENVAGGSVCACSMGGGGESKSGQCRCACVLCGGGSSYNPGE